MSRRDPANCCKLAARRLCLQENTILALGARRVLNYKRSSGNQIREVTMQAFSSPYGADPRS